MNQHPSPLITGLDRHLSKDQLGALQQISVGIAGAGGLGSNIAMMLARSGIQRFTLVDFDCIEPSNLNRQFFFPDQIGKPKVEALAEHLRRLNPEIELSLHVKRLTRENILETFSGCQVIVEAFDGAAAKAMCYQAFKNTGCFYTGASGLAGWKTEALSYRFLDDKTVIVGDFSTGVNETNPPMAPKVMQAAGMQANAVLAHILDNLVSS